MTAPEPDPRHAEAEFEQRGPTVRDRRRIDPETYQVREPQETAAPAAAAPEPETPTPETPPVPDLEAEVKELQDKLAEFQDIKEFTELQRAVSEIEAKGYDIGGS